MGTQGRICKWYNMVQSLKTVALNTQTHACKLAPQIQISNSNKKKKKKKKKTLAECHINHPH